MFAVRNKKRLYPRVPLRLLVSACLALAMAAPAWAQPTNWTLKISEKEMQLAHPTDMGWMKYNMWDVTYERMFDRNTPTLELTNESATDTINQLKLTIGDVRFHFANDFFAGNSPLVLGNTTPGFSLSPALSADKNELTINILDGGLGPGEKVRFRIDIDTDAGHPNPPFFEHPDFRTVMFDINAGGGTHPVEVYDSNLIRDLDDDNSHATVTFASAGVSGPFAFQDHVINGPADPLCQPCQGTQDQFFNQTMRAYGIMENVDIFEIGGGDTPVIPEPTAATLMLVGLVSSLGFGRRSRRQAAAR